MKKVMLTAILLTFGANAFAVVKCKSMRDPNFVAYFEGYTCPAGFYQVF